MLDVAKYFELCGNSRACVQENHSIHYVASMYNDCHKKNLNSNYQHLLDTNVGGTGTSPDLVDTLY